MRVFHFLLAGIAALSVYGHSGVRAAAALETEAAFVARCTKESIASNPESKPWAEGACKERWASVVAARPMADALLAAMPATPTATDPATLRAKLTMVKWTGKPQGNQIALGTLGDVSVAVAQKPNQLSFDWSKIGELVPYELDEALLGMGAKVDLVGCQKTGPGEYGKVFNVTAPGHAPFELSIYARNAPTANAWSSYIASTNLTGKPETLAHLRAGQGGEMWEKACPQ